MHEPLGLGLILQQKRVCLFVYRCADVHHAWLSTFAPNNTTRVLLYGHAYRCGRTFSSICCRHMKVIRCVFWGFPGTPDGPTPSTTL